MWWQFGLQILPVLLLGILILGTAYTITPVSSDPVLTLIFASLAVLFFMAMLTFREQYGWNLALLLGFSGALGTVFSFLSAGSMLAVGFESIWIVLLSLSIGASAGRWLGEHFGEFGVILWLVSWAYLLGWAFLIFLELDPVFILTWSGVGLLLFTGLSGVWFANMEAHFKQRSSVSAAIDLYLISINLYLAAMILQSIQI